MNDLNLAPVQKPGDSFLSPLITDSGAIKTLGRRKSTSFNFKTIHKADLEEEITKGWEIFKDGKKNVKVKKQKTHDTLLEDRVWCLFEKMGYTQMNGDKFNISFTRDDGSIGKKQIDVFACDEETALVVECKSKEKRGRRTLQKDLHETIFLQDYIRKTIFKYYSGKPLPKIVWIYATDNIIWSEPDVERATDGNIIIITENEIQYFEAFLKHMGSAGKYQILSEFLKNQKIPGITDVKMYRDSIHLTLPPLAG